MTSRTRKYCSIRFRNTTKHTTATGTPTRPHLALLITGPNPSCNRNQIRITTSLVISNVVAIQTHPTRCALLCPISLSLSLAARLARSLPPLIFHPSLHIFTFALTTTRLGGPEMGSVMS